VPQGLRVGVLSPFVGGDYYGALIAAVNAAAVADGGRVVAIQTLDPGSQGADWSGVPDARHAVAWGHLDAAVVLPGAVDAACVRRLRAAGTHVVLLGHDLPDAGCPAVSADNRSGVRDAVAHLVGHGHRRIAFAGLISVSDVRERYEGYRDGLRDAGIEAVPDLFLGAPDNHESGGVVAARQLLAAAGRLGSLPPPRW